MHRTLTVVLVLLAASVAFSQDAGELTKRRDAKLAEAWLSANPWITDYEKAREAAADSGRLIFAYFTRSYAP